MKKFAVLPFLCAVTLCLSARVLPAQSLIFLTRHAEKAESEDKNNPPLSEAGQARAKALARILEDTKISTIYVTEYVRTQQTAAPTAAETEAKIKQLPAADIPALITQLKAEPGNVLVVGHANTLPEIIKALGFPEPHHIDDANYSNLYVVFRGEKPQLLRLHYPLKAYGQGD